MSRRAARWLPHWCLTSWSPEGVERGTFSEYGVLVAAALRWCRPEEDPRVCAASAVGYIYRLSVDIIAGRDRSWWGRYPLADGTPLPSDDHLTAAVRCFPFLAALRLYDEDRRDDLLLETLREAQVHPPSSDDDAVGGWLAVPRRAPVPAGKPIALPRNWDPAMPGMAAQFDDLLQRFCQGEAEHIYWHAGVDTGVGVK